MNHVDPPKRRPTFGPSDNRPDARSAADLIREKLDRIYGDEPSATTELAESAAVARRSKHQQFMFDLSKSGKDLATIQTEWHKYYEQLPADEKHQVWQEFYDSQSLATGQPTLAEPKPAEPEQAKPSGTPDAPQTPSAAQEFTKALEAQKAAQKLAELKNQTKRSDYAKPAPSKPPKLRDARSKADVQAAIRDKVTAGGKLQTKHHIQSLLFGLGMGAVVVVIFLFGFFNEVIIAPFIQPSRVAAATPLIVTSNSVAPTTTPQVIIPKINVEIPVNYNETSTDENTIENDLQNGVVHYPTTVMPGQVGNTAFFGHSSNNIFNKGKYKFAFVLLHTLVEGDTFYLTYNDKVYVYKVISRSIVDPSDIGVLGPVSGQTATATLITCDPPGTSLHRLIVVGQQISPDPSGNSQPAVAAVANPNVVNELPGNGPTLWARFIGSGIGKAIVVVAILGAFVWVIRWVNAPMRQMPR